MIQPRTAEKFESNFFMLRAKVGLWARRGAAASTGAFAVGYASSLGFRRSVTFWTTVTPFYAEYELTVSQMYLHVSFNDLTPYSLDPLSIRIPIVITRILMAWILLSVYTPYLKQCISMVAHRTGPCIM